MQLSNFYVQAIAAAKTGKIRPRRVLILAFIVGLAVLSIASINIKAAHAGQPVSPPPPPVKFALTIAPAPVSVRIEDMSDFGELVGAHNTLGVGGGIMRACIVTGIQIKFLEEIVPAPAGWYYARATGINENGSIVGYMYRNNEPIDSAKKHGFVIHRPFELDSYVKEIPDFELNRPFPVDINDDGVLLGSTFDFVQNAHGLYVFDTYGTDASLLPTALPVVTFAGGGINNAMPPQVFGRTSDLKPFIYTLGSLSPQILNFERIDAMNDMGAFCGPVTQRKSAIAYRYRSGVYQTFPDAKSGASEINENGDMIFGSGRVGSAVQLYSEGRGTLNLGNLVLGNATEVSLFRNYTVVVKGLTERGSLNPLMSGFPGIGGMISGPNGLVPFTLTPVAP